MFSLFVTIFELLIEIFWVLLLTTFSIFSKLCVRRLNLVSMWLAVSIKDLFCSWRVLSFDSNNLRWVCIFLSESSRNTILLFTDFQSMSVRVCSISCSFFSRAISLSSWVFSVCTSCIVSSSCFPILSCKLFEICVCEDSCSSTTWLFNICCSSNDLCLASSDSLDIFNWVTSFIKCCSCFSSWTTLSSRPILFWFSFCKLLCRSLKLSCRVDRAFVSCTFVCSRAVKFSSRAVFLLIRVMFVSSSLVIFCSMCLKLCSRCSNFSVMLMLVMEVCFFPSSSISSMNLWLRYLWSLLVSSW